MIVSKKSRPKMELKQPGVNRRFFIVFCVLYKLPR